MIFEKKENRKQECILKSTGLLKTPTNEYIKQEAIYPKILFSE